MKTYFILSAVGKDRPGIVADVSEVIFQCGGNIEDSSMGLLRNHFALLLLFSLDEGQKAEALSSSVEKLKREKGLTVFSSPMGMEEAHPPMQEQVDYFEITTSGVDHTGIVFRVCRLLADRGINILDMKTRRVLSAESGTPLFEMDIGLEVPKSVPEPSLREDLHRLANELVIDLVFKRA